MANHPVEQLKQAWYSLPDYEQQHSFRSARVAVALGAKLGMAEKELVTFWYGAMLHDVGKAHVDRSILLKPGPLTPEEQIVVRKHPQHGHDMLAPIPGFKDSLDVPLYHHERWDGYGYPRGLKGEAIPLAARLFAVVDVWDALRAARPYSPPWPDERAREHIIAGSGSHFDPTLVEQFIYSLRDKRLTMPTTSVLGRLPLN
ncbi:MAG: HD-GYP domain-containing protein [Chloroflexi bacterium]|nr:HD-GYP domain-containing protein [Chloroflexota bacterium]